MTDTFDPGPPGPPYAMETPDYPGLQPLGQPPGQAPVPPVSGPPEPPSPAGPRARSPDEVMDSIFGRQRRAVAQVAGVALDPEAKPEAAAKAQKASQTLGTPPEATILDPEGFAQQAIFEQTQRLVNKNPHLQNYVDTVPNAAQLSKGDFDKLDILSKYMEALEGPYKAAALNARLLWNTPWVQSWLGHGSDLEAIRKQTTENAMRAAWAPFATENLTAEEQALAALPLDKQRGLRAFTVIPAGLSALHAFGRTMTGVLGATTQQAAGIAREFGATPESAQKLAGELTMLADVVMASEMAGGAHVLPESAIGQLARHVEQVPAELRGTIRWPTAPDISPSDFVNSLNKAKTATDANEFVKQLNTGKFDPSMFSDSPELAKDVSRIKEGQGFKPEDPARAIEVHQAEQAAEDLDRAVSVANETKTRNLPEIGPEATENFLNSKPAPEGQIEPPPGFIHIPVERVLQIYKAEGKAPGAGVGPLEWIPDLAKQVAAATELETPSGEMRVPMISVDKNKYVARIDPAVHEKLRDVLRIGDDVESLEDAEVRKKTEPHSEVHPDVIGHLADLQPEAFESIHPEMPAALRHEGEVTSGASHQEIEAGVREKKELDPEEEVKGERGFLTTRGRFVGEEEAEEIAHRSGQLARPRNGTLSTSELKRQELHKSVTEREIDAEAAVEAAKKAEAEAKAEGEAPEEEKPLIEEEAPVEAKDLAPAKEETRARPGANTKRLAQLLGPKLYGDPTNMDQVTVKEMLQNSFDAIKALLEKGQLKNPKIDIEFDKKARTITITDNGSGMTAETLGGPFLRIADTLKETGSSSGGFGIAKMLFLFGNKQLHVATMRDGKVSTMITTGEELFNALEDPNRAPVINTVLATKDHKKLFPDGHGTIIEVVLPESFKDPSTGEQKKIEFRTGAYWHDSVTHSPLFRDIDVTMDGKPVPIGKNFPHEQFTQFVNARFDWGTARIYITKDEKVGADWQENVHVLSNGIHQFSFKLPADPAKPYDKNIPRELYIDVDSKAAPTEPGYPFDLNRQGFTKHAREDLKKITRYIQAQYQQEQAAKSAMGFGDIQYYDEKGRPAEIFSATPERPEQKTIEGAIAGGEDVQVRDGKLIVKGKEIPELTEKDLAAARVDVSKLMIPQEKIDPNRVMLHDNMEILFEGEYHSLVDMARAKFGDRFDSYVFGVGDTMKTLRNVVAAVMKYPALAKEGVGISFDQEYRGVSIKLPFSGMFLNPAVPKYTDPVRAAVGMIGTMIHEFAHHKVRSHDADFPAEMQDIIIQLDALEHFEAQRVSLKVPPFPSLVKIKEEMIAHVKKHQDVLEWLNKQVTSVEQVEGQPVVRNRGQRFKEPGERQAVDARVPFGDEGPTEAVRSGYEALRPAFQRIDEGEGPSTVPGGDRSVSGNPELDRLLGVAQRDGYAAQDLKASRRARRELFLDPLLTKGKTLNIDQSLYRDYSNGIERNKLKQLERAVKFATKQREKIEGAQWAKEKEAMRPGVEWAIQESPAFAADRFFNTNKGMLPGGRKITPSAFEEMGEAKADEWATFFGFPSGSAMTTAVLALEMERKDAGKGPKWQLKQHVEAELERRMEEKYGNLKDNAAIDGSEEALAAYNLDDILIPEIKLLAAHFGRKPPITRADLDTWVAIKFGEKNAASVSSKLLSRATERAGKTVEKALIKGKIERALAAAQVRAKAYITTREAVKFEKEREKAQALFSKYARMVEPKGIALDYMIQIQSLLAARGMKTAMRPDDLHYNRAGKTIEQFIAEKLGQGEDIPLAQIPVWKGLKEFNVDEFRDFTKMIESLDELGRNADKIQVLEDKRNFDDTVHEMLSNLSVFEKPGDRFEVTGLVSKLRETGRYTDAELLKMERMFDAFDHSNPHGPFNKLLRGLLNGNEAKGDMLAQLSKQVKGFADRKWSRTLGVRVDNQELLDPDTGNPMVLTKLEAHGIAFNYANLSNRRVLIHAHGWSEADIEKFLERVMTAKDWEMHNKFLRLFDPLKPYIEAASKARTGIAVPLIAPARFLESKGGYWPLIPNPKDKKYKRRSGEDLFDRPVYDILPSAAALKRRTGAVYKLDLKALGYIHSVIEHTTHVVMLQEPVKAMNRVLNEPAIEEAIDSAMGPEYYAAAKKWIRDIANNGGGFDDSSKMANVMRMGRTNVATAVMGFKASTALIHLVSAGAASAYEIGPIQLANNIRKLGLGNLPQWAQRFWANNDTMAAQFKEVMDLSAFMRNRQRNLDKNFGSMMQMALRQGFVDDYKYYRALWQGYSMALVSYFDLLTATPVWKAAYEKAFAEAMERERKAGRNDWSDEALAKHKQDAIYVADKAVREAHGSVDLISRANISRAENPIEREVRMGLTLAYNGYWNHNYNKMRSVQGQGDLGEVFGGGPPPPRGPRPGMGGPEDIPDGDKDPGMGAGARVLRLAAFATALIIVPALWHHAIHGAPRDQKKNEEEDDGSVPWTALEALGSQFAGMVPGVNSLWFSMTHGYKDPQLTPLQEAGHIATDAARDVWKTKKPKRQLAHLIKLGALLTGAPITNQIVDTGSYMTQVTDEDKDPDSVWTWIKGILQVGDKGRPKP